MSNDFAIWAFLGIFNLATVVLMRVSLKPANFSAALIDKDALTSAKAQMLNNGGVDPGGRVVAAAMTAPAVGVNQTQVAVTPPSVVSADYVSSSRIAMMTGITVLASFLWALGNVIIYRSFGDLTQVGVLMKNVWPFFVAGSALFAPYAFNQIKGAFN